MAITVICPNLRCRSVLQVPDNIRSKTVRCGKCGKNFIVPAAPPPKTKIETESEPEQVQKS